MHTGTHQHNYFYSAEKLAKWYNMLLFILLFYGQQKGSNDDIEISYVFLFGNFFQCKMKESP